MMAAATFKRDGRKQEKEGERLWGKETGTIIPSTSYPMATLLVATVVTLESPAFHLTHLVNQEPTSDIQNLSRKPDSHSLQPAWCTPVETPTIEVSGTCADATIAFLGLENPRNATLGSLGAGVTIERLCTSWHLSFPLTITTVHEQAKKVYIRALEGWEEQM
ncbi:hypothetical protein WG66_005381 [Moniliophthora roreri]|nr:hypothetical protein WG66_005381 [Moniliophthora roreri]